ncbi:MAG: BatA domain-containing protein, partial [Pirellulaceae bacterium]
MTWLSALAPWQWAVMAAVPLAIFLLYFLKLKRQPLEVPSTLLWRQAVEDMRVNSLWQKLRRNLLLLLQLLFVAALMLAALRPGWSGSMGSGKRYIFLIDHSASMSATDVAGSRLEEAKRLAIQRIDSLQRGDVAMVVA